MKLATVLHFIIAGISSSSHVNAEPLLRGAQTTTFEQQAAEASLTLAVSYNPEENPNLGGPVQDGQKCYGPHNKYCANGLYCIVAESGTCNRDYRHGGAYCCPSGTRLISGGCEPDPACNFGPPSPSPPSPPSPPATPGPTWAPMPTPPHSNSKHPDWTQGCPGDWGGLSHDGGNAYDFHKDPNSGNWACRPQNHGVQKIEQDSLDKFKSGGEFQTIMVGGNTVTVQKTFG